MLDDGFNLAVGDSWVVIIKTLNVLWRDAHGHGFSVSSCLVCECVFACLIYSVPLHWLNAVNVKWQYFNVGNAGQCGFWLCAVNILLFLSVKSVKIPISHSQDIWHRPNPHDVFEKSSWMTCRREMH